MTDRERLEEATALLDLFVDGARNALQFMRDDLPSAAEEMLKAILSRAPAQPAAPTPECRYGGSFCGDTSCPTHGVAPEPSGENDWLELIRLREFVKGTSSTAPIVHFMLRAESAESQLAAVLMTVEGIRGYMHSTLADSTFVLKGPTAQRVRDLVASLLTAPSPGAGEETL